MATDAGRPLLLCRILRFVSGILWYVACLGYRDTLGGVPCRIEVVEAGSGWPVPLVELRTTHQLTWITDNAGVAAIDALELQGREVYFHVSSDGYELAKDGFGNRGVRVEVREGAVHRVELTRTMIARRLGRLTGAGLFAESQKTGRDLDWKESGVFGCDSAQSAIHRGQRYWLWGDTTLAHYPLGLFDSLGATSKVHPLDTVTPPLKLNYDFFRDAKGRPRGITPMPGDGPTWATAMVSLPDRNGTPRLVCTYMKIQPPMDAYEWGLAVWNEETRRFDRHQVIWKRAPDALSAPNLPVGHAVFWQDTNRVDWVLFCHPFPTLKCRANFESWQNPRDWQPVESSPELLSAKDGVKVRAHTGVHAGGMGWHPWRRRWVSVFQESGGTPSPLGELWYAEAASPLGPWGPAVKVLTHRNYTFYNPCLHLDWGLESGPVILFEGTYTREFSRNPTPTPRYDYNQILYGLDLEDPRIAPARVRGE